MFNRRNSDSIQLEQGCEQKQRALFGLSVPLKMDNPKWEKH